MSDYKYVTLYCARKFDTKGSGLLYKRIDFNDEDHFTVMKKEIQEKQKLDNALYRKDNPVAKKEGKRAIKKRMAGEKMDLTKEEPMNNNFGVNVLGAKTLLDNTIDHLPKLQLDEGTGNSILLLASAKSGKSHILKEIYNTLYKDKKKQIEVLFSVNSHAKIYDDFSDKLKVNKFNRDSEKMINQMKKINMVTKNKFDYLIMLDDVVDAKYSGVLNNLILTYRNSNFSSIVALQYPYLLSKGSRSSVNQTIFGFFNTDESIESVIKSFLSSTFSKMGYHQLPAQVQLYRELTKDHYFLYFFPRNQTLIRFKISI
tara:strand:+ start:162 stop:1103 length:942 start_codon:yes stop_codon:yes gene_type:complete